MAVSSNVYEPAIANAFAGAITYTAAATHIKMGLLTSSYTPNLANAHWSDVNANEVSGTGYTAGGVTLSSLTVTQTVANSWATARANSTGYNDGDIVRPATGNGFLYISVTGASGTSGASVPTYPTEPGQTVVDGTVTWSCLGESITVYSSANAQWTSATFSAAYGVIYDSTTGTASTEPLIALVNFGGTLSPSSGTLTVSPSANGWFFSSPA